MDLGWDPIQKTGIRFTGFVFVSEHIATPRPPQIRTWATPAAGPDAPTSSPLSPCLLRRLTISNYSSPAVRKQGMRSSPLVPDDQRVCHSQELISLLPWPHAHLPREAWSCHQTQRTWSRNPRGVHRRSAPSSPSSRRKQQREKARGPGSLSRGWSFWGGLWAGIPAQPRSAAQLHRRVWQLATPGNSEEQGGRPGVGRQGSKLYI